MSTNEGDKILALDQPFVLSFGDANQGSTMDAPGGIWAVYGFKYDVDGDKGIVIQQSGITMVQHLTIKNDQNQLHIFSGQMTPRLAQFSAMIAANHSGTIGGPAPFSNSSLIMLDLP